MKISIVEKIKQNAKTLNDWEIECKQLIPKNALKISNKSKEWIPYDTVHLAELVRVDDVLKILSDHDKQLILARNETAHYLNKLEEEKQKLRELADFIHKNRPKISKGGAVYIHSDEIDECFEKIEKKFAELGVKPVKKEQ